MGHQNSRRVKPLRMYLVGALSLTGLAAFSMLADVGLAASAPIATKPTSAIASSKTSKPARQSASTRQAQTKQSFVDIELSNRSLRQGSRGADVEALQRALDREGLYTDAFDGNYGPATSQAVSDFQRQNGLNPTGQADSRTLETLGFILPGEALAATPTPRSFTSDLGTLTQSDLSPGDTGPNVVILQRALNRNGAGLSEDGIYGPGTTQAVRAFQRQERLPDTGVADGRTLQILGFRSRRNRYVAAIIENPGTLSDVQRIYPNAIIDSVRQGNFINIGSYPNRRLATERVNAARARGLSARVLYR